MAAPQPIWRLRKSDDFLSELQAACGRDGGLRNRAEKKLAKLQQNPNRPRAGKTGALAGLKSEPVNPYVILYSVEPDAAHPPGVIHLRGFWHHNDRRYDP